MNLFNKMKTANDFEIKVTKHFSVSIWFFPVLICSVAGRYFDLFFTTLAVAFLHEIAHVLCARMFNISVTRITLLPFGVVARLSSEYIRSSEKEFLIAFAGPFVNITLFWVSTFLSAKTSLAFADSFCTINLLMAALNLMPCLPLDGGRMLKSILASRYGFLKAYNFTMKISKIIIFLMFFAGITLVVLSGFNFSLVLISAFLFQNISRESNTISHIFFREILENSAKLNQNKVARAKIFCVSSNSSASTILKVLSYDYYCIFHITDSNAKIIKTLTETQILENLTHHSVRTKLSEI